MPVDVLEAEVLSASPAIDRLDTSVGGTLAPYRPPVEATNTRPAVNTVPQPGRGLDGVVDSKGRPYLVTNDDGQRVWNDSFKFDDIPEYGTPEFSDWANGQDLDPEAFDRYVDRANRGRGRALGKALDSLPIIGAAVDFADFANFAQPFLDDALPYQRRTGNIALDLLLDRFFPSDRTPDGLPINQPGDPPFEGGQCAGVRYGVRVTVRFDTEHGRGSAVAQPIPYGQGPVSGATIFNGRPPGETPSWNVRVNFANGPKFVNNVQFGGEKPSISNIAPFRDDGQPDNCGNPQGEAVPTAPDTPTITRPPNFPPIPRIDPPGLPGLPQLPRLPQLDLPDPRNETEPAPDSEFDPIRPVLPQLPQLPELPEPEPEGERPPASDSPPGEDGDCCDRTLYDIATLKERLDQIWNYFQVSGTETLDLASCDSPQPQIDAWEGTGLAGLYRGLETLSRGIDDIWAQIRCNEGSAVAIPEWWAVRPGADVPQLAITFKSQQGSSYWSLTIPHYNKPQNVKPQIPAYEKGSYFATLTLKDNTKLVVNAKSFNEGERVILSLAGYIDPAFLTTPLNIHQGRRRGAALTEVRVIPTRGYFYSTGQQDSRPDWVTDIEVI
ncbi:MAG: hypothetical protein F6J97_15285 [Leptolyngbya sp. SIO4C1]|nr:hypothetical protein [Leptolyngbya sp. SIO4C1]